MHAALSAIALILVVPVAAVFSWVCRVRNATVLDFAKRLAFALGAAMATAAIPGGLFACRCGAGNNPIRQVLVPAIGAMVCVLLLDSVRKRWLGFMGALISSLLLAAHFHAMVLPTNTSQCWYTGDPEFVANSCATPVEAERAWYTPITGLYRLRIPR